MTEPEIEWRIGAGLVPYDEALSFMERRTAAIRDRGAPECIWLVEHPPLFTAGTSADPAELLNPLALPVFTAGRGGRYTYHGPGQRVVYVLLDLERRGRDIRGFVQALEGWMIATLRDLGIAAHRAPGRIGIWVGSGPEERKIGALGVRVRRWVTLHGMAINVAPNLDHFDGIVPCGIRQFGVTSIEKLGNKSSISDVDRSLARNLPMFLNALSAKDKVS